MAALKLTLSQLARHDLKGLWLHLAADNMDAADALVDRLYNTMERLTLWPELGRKRSELAPDVHSFADNPYVVFYRATNAELEIVRVLHGKRDIDSEF